MNDNNFTRLTLETGYGKKVVFEYDHSDVSPYDIMHAIYTCMIGATYSPEVVLNAMLEFVEEQKGVNYYIETDAE